MESREVPAMASHNREHPAVATPRRKRQLRGMPYQAFPCLNWDPNPAVLVRDLTAATTAPRVLVQVRDLAAATTAAKQLVQVRDRVAATTVGEGPQVRQPLAVRRERLQTAGPGRRLLPVVDRLEKTPEPKKTIRRASL